MRLAACEQAVDPCSPVDDWLSARPERRHDLTPGPPVLQGHGYGPVTVPPRLGARVDSVTSCSEHILTADPAPHPKSSNSRKVARPASAHAGVDPVRATVKYSEFQGNVRCVFCDVGHPLAFYCCTWHLHSSCSVPLFVAKNKKRDMDFVGVKALRIIGALRPSFRLPRTMTGEKLNELAQPAQSMQKPRKKSSTSKDVQLRVCMLMSGCTATWLQPDTTGEPI